MEPQCLYPNLVLLLSSLLLIKSKSHYIAINSVQSQKDYQVMPSLADAGRKGRMNDKVI